MFNSNTSKTVGGSPHPALGVMGGTLTHLPAALVLPGRLLPRPAAAQAVYEPRLCSREEGSGDALSPLLPPPPTHPPKRRRRARPYRTPGLHARIRVGEDQIRARPAAAGPG